MKKILITGACGYLGARLSKNLAEKGYEVHVFDSFDPSKYSQWASLMAEIIVGDIRDEKTVSDLANKQFDLVIHLISLDYLKSKDNPNVVSSINVMPTWNLLDKLTKNGLKKFIYFSTIHVYGGHVSKITKECQTPKPHNVYGLTHLLSENICSYFNDKTETQCINLRLSNTYGSPIFNENNCWWLVINDLVRTAFNERRIKLISDGSPQRDFIHGDDVVKAIEILINYQKNISKNILHIASGQTLTILELAHLIKKLYYKRYNNEIDIFLPDNSVSTNPRKFKDIPSYKFSVEKMNKIGFKQKIDLESGINELFQYFES